jgi:NADH-quinone oxidoreductase subunit G
MPDGVVWLPTNAPGRGIFRHLGANAGDVVAVRPYPTVPRPSDPAENKEVAK